MGPEMTADRVGPRNIGAFGGWQAPNDWIEFLRREGTLHFDARGYVQGIMHCCTANGGRAMFDVWRNTVTASGDSVRVNLLLNHAGPWLDVDSHVPYAGRVDLHVKKACRLAVRVPAWVEPGRVECSVGDKPREIKFDGRYAAVGRVEAGQAARLTFPIRETTDRVSMKNQWYFLVRRGYDVVFIDPPGRLCPLYQRDHYRGGATLWKNVTRYVSEQRLGD